MQKKLSCALLFLSSFLASTANAAAAFDLKHLEQLFNSYHRTQAYQYASQYVDQMEGDGNFDYLYGVSAIDTGHASQGVFALERVLMQFPDDQLARLELARGYFILEEYARSREEFENVMATNPPKGVQKTVASFLEQIRLKESRYRTTSGGFLALGLGHDSNVNSGPSDSGISYLQLSSSSLGQADTFSELTASWGIGHPIAPGWMVTGNITGAMQKNQTLSDYDNVTGTLQAGITRLYKDSRYKGQLLYQQYQLNGDKYRTMDGINLEWQTSLSETNRINTALQYLKLDYPTIDTKNSKLSSLSFTWSHNFSSLWSPVVFTSLNAGKETPDTDNSTVERNITGLRIGGTLSFTSTLALQASAGLQISKYPNQIYLVGYQDTKRKDNLTTANATLLWLINKNWRLDTQVNYTRNDAKNTLDGNTIGIYSYKRTVASMELNYSF